jgi:VanZ like family
MLLTRIGLLLLSSAFIVFAVAVPKPILAALQQNYWWFGGPIGFFEGISVTGEPIHIVLFAVLAVVARTFFSTTSVVKLVLSMVLFAGLTEGIQLFSPGREASFNDLNANLAGIATGLVVVSGVSAFLCNLPFYR